MDFFQAKSIFEYTLNSEKRVSKGINDGLWALVNKPLIEEVSQLVSDAIYGGERVWITSDLHFGHSNIISYSGRPFHDERHQTDVLLQLMSKIPDDEFVVLVGDVAKGINYEPGVEIMKQLPGRKILVVGNHDLTKDGKCRLADEGIFEAVLPFLFWQGLKDTSVLVSHYPVVEYFPMPVPKLINYHGHLHQWVKESTEGVKFINVGWDRTHSLLCL
jgi:calcineurin-like phosphoesterase family protein